MPDDKELMLKSTSLAVLGTKPINQNIAVSSHLQNK